MRIGRSLKTRLAKAGVLVGTRARLNLIEGTNVTITAVDDAPNDELDITIAATGAGGAPTDADYLVGTANASLSAEIVVGATPGGELGGTWAAPTVDATHSGSAHHAQLHATAHEPAGGDTMAVDAVVGTGSLRTLGAGAQQASAGNHTHAGAGHTIQDDDLGLTQRANLSFQDGFILTDDAVGNQSEVDLSYGAAGYPVDSVIGTEADGAAITLARADHQHSITAPVAGYPLDVAAAEGDGTSANPARGDHVHAHGSGYLPNAHHAQSHVLDPGDHTISGKTAGQFLRATSATAFAFEAVPFSISALYKVPVADDFAVWLAPFACTVTAIKAYQDVGTGSTINAFKGTLAAPTLFRSANLATATADTWADGGAVQNMAVAVGDAIYFRIATVAGAPAEVAIQLNLTRP